VARFRRHAWWVLAGLIALFGLFSVGDIAGGLAFESRTTLRFAGLTPNDLQAESEAAYQVLDYVVRASGITFVGLAIVLLIILLVPYRGAMRWAWRVMWVFPAWMAAVFALGLATPSAAGQGQSDGVLSAPIIFVISTVILLIDRSRFGSVKADVVHRVDDQRAGSVTP
jgi:hypothetical protein